MSIFTIDPRIAAVTLPIVQLELSEVRLMNDSRFCWCILMPQRSDKCGVHELSMVDQQLLIIESSLVSDALQKLLNPDRINVGALGNIVPQLHWHVVARHQQDPCWPGPVWGCGKATPYPPNAAAERIEQLRNQLPS